MHGCARGGPAPLPTAHHHRSLLRPPQVDQTVQGASGQVELSTNVGLAPKGVAADAASPVFHQTNFAAASSPPFNATYANAYRNYKLVWTPGYLVRSGAHRDCFAPGGLFSRF